MKFTRKFSLSVGLAALLLCLCGGNYLIPDPGACAAENESSVSSGLTLPLGSPMRKEILNALREEMWHMHGIKMVFRVRYLKVKDGWAWIQTLPQSPDGLNHYEDVSALLCLRGGAWQVVEFPCTEAEQDDCLGSDGYFIQLKKRYQKVPIEILPIPPDVAQGRKP